MTDSADKIKVSEGILSEVKLVSLIGDVETSRIINKKTIRTIQLADSFVDVGDFEDAIKLCEESIESFPYYHTAYLVLARACFAKGQTERGTQILEDFIIKHPSHVKAHKWLGDLMMSQGDLRRASSHYRIALRSDPINKELIQTLLDMRSEMGKEGRAGTVKAEPVAEVDTPTAEAASEETVVGTPPSEVASDSAEIEKPPVEEKSTELERELKSKDMGELLFDSPIQEQISSDRTDEVESPPAQEEVPETVPESAPQAVETSGNIPSELASDLESKGLHPAYVDEAGLLYFYEDEDLTFEQYKYRNDLISAGKAAVMERRTLDQKIAVARGEEPPSVEAEPVPTLEEVTPAVVEPEAAVADEAVVEGPSDDDQVTLLDELEMSYRDYLDMLTEEEELLAAVFPADEETFAEAPTVLQQILGEEGADDEPIRYSAYVQGLTDEAEKSDALLDDDVEISFADYMNSLEANGELIDFHTYQLVGDPSEWADLDGLADEPKISYGEYMSGLGQDEERDEATLEVVGDRAEVAVVEEPKVEEEVSTGADAKVTMPEEIAEEVTGEPEEEAMPAQAVVFDEEPSLELVDKYAVFGQYGSAFRVCKALKQKNPTDAKIERKILELKKLYIWSTQLVG